MIEITNTDVYGWQAAIRGMRNPMNSWDKSDSGLTVANPDDVELGYDPIYEYRIGEIDLKRMRSLARLGDDHGKYLRMIVVTTDIVAPLYWWKEYDTYKVGTVANSCSTMHKLDERPLTLDDFSHEHLVEDAIPILQDVIDAINDCQDALVNYDAYLLRGIFKKPFDKKEIWWQMMQLLPTSYNQRRTVQLNYQVLKNMYFARKTHKLDEWHEFCRWVEHLPYFKEIILNAEQELDK